MQFLMSSTERTVKVTHLDHLTGEFVGEGEVYVPPMMGLPAFCTQVTAPKEKEGFARIFDKAAQSWSYTEDNRGKTVYDKNTAFPFVVSSLGPLSEGMTALAPVSPYSKWTDKGWIVDEAAVREAAEKTNTDKKIYLFNNATQNMIPLQNAVKHEIATDEEIQLLAEWERYTVLLNRVDVSAGDEIIWPAVPGNVA